MDPNESVLYLSAFSAVKNDFVVLQIRMALVVQKQAQLGCDLFEHSSGMSHAFKGLVFSPLTEERGDKLVLKQTSEIDAICKNLDWLY